MKHQAVSRSFRFSFASSPGDRLTVQEPTGNNWPGRENRPFRAPSPLAQVILLLFLLAVTPVHALSQGPDDTIWDQVRQGKAVAFVRHALAPGVGDPGHFRIGDCTTQRNLSDEGRRQAQRIGDRFRANGITGADVYTSQWCRCIETAKLLNLGLPKGLPLLNSFFETPGNGASQTGALRMFIRSLGGEKPAIFVTHQVNITALTGIVPSSGEIIVFQIETDDDGLLLGRFAVP